MRKKGQKLSKKLIFCVVCIAVIGTILIATLGLQIAFVIADTIECWRPDYEKADILPVLQKDALTDSDYEFLYRQTGLTRAGIDGTLENDGVSRILRIQDDFFTEHEVKNGYFAPFVCTDFIDSHIAYAHLQDGDIFVTSSTHLSGWRIGHAGLVTDVYGSGADVLQANAIGTTSVIGTAKDFTNRCNFMILRPKADAETKEKVVEFAKENLTGKVYDPTAGVFSDKKTVDRTQCAHLVWYAYDYFGIDLDCGGGLVVTPRDIANSPLVDVVQVFGFDLDNLWKY